MTPRFLHACQTFQPAEKACWEILLREEKTTAPIPARELDRAMDRTLEQLWSLLQSSSVETWIAEAKALAPLLPRAKDCGLPAMLAYFDAGRRALELITKELSAEQKTDAVAQAKENGDLQFAFSVLVQHHLQTLCGTCGRDAQCPFNGQAMPWRQEEARRTASRKATRTAAGPWKRSGRRTAG